MKKAIHQRLLAWYDIHGRTLPFRGTKDPYRIWVSEIMLQQTRTETAGSYFLRFTQRFPDVFALADAEEQDVLKMWEGLGYYSRARNLHKAAKKVAYEWNGVFPADYEQLLSLPGVGEYTAAAVASIAFDLPHPAMDGNLTRVLSRVHGIREDVGIPSVKRQLLALAQKDMPSKRCGDFNQALMDLGASLCCPGTPDCDKCPLNSLCDACREGDADLLPVKAIQKPPLEIPMAVLIITCKNKILLSQRKEALLKNLWVYPLAEDVSTETEVKNTLGKMGLIPLSITPLEQAKHVFSHRVWHMQLWHVETEEAKEKAGLWFTYEQMQSLPIPTAVKAARAAAEHILAPEVNFLPLQEHRSLIRDTARVYCESWQHAHRDHATPEMKKEYTPLFMEMILRSHLDSEKAVYALQANGQIAGVLVLDKKENELCTLYIRPVMQKRNIGTKAVQFAIEQLDKHRNMKVTALEKNPHIIRLYQKSGFTLPAARTLLNREYDLWEQTLIRPGEKE
ncbi:MAG: A/G-specific adenine glycosylase [Clostridia bacterium]|nr:A/G-specific adenine glycosylase [Clostridia bacterium]